MQMQTETDKSTDWGPYLRFAAMIGTAAVAMYALTYTNVFAFAHIHFSQERLYMTLIMTCSMTIIMMGFMWRMYANRAINLTVIAAAVVVGCLGFAASQQQWFVGDRTYMLGMIPHHSIAILTSERAHIEDLRVRELADGISSTQVEEIAEMEWLLNDIAENGPATTEEQARQRPVPDFSGK